MSTYTDLRNRVKENITVGYDASDRTTVQKVKFHNEENEYWGTFTGKVSVDNVTINAGTINDVSVYDSYIKNATLVNSDGIKINLSELGEGVDEISNVTIPAVRAEIRAVSAEISSLQNVAGEVEQLKQDVAYVSCEVSSEVSARTQADLMISAYLSGEFDAKLSAEREQRISADDILDTAVKTEADTRKAADDGLSGAAEAYVEENKHYHIEPVNSDVKMPFKAKEFAVNVINDYDLPDAFVKDAATGEMVAKVERYAATSRNCEFVPFTDASDKYLAILGTDAFVFGDAQTKRDCKDPAYRLTYYRDGETGAVTDQHFGLAPVDVGIRHVYHNEKSVGVVTRANEETVVSGYVRINADSQSPLSVFSDGLDHYFRINGPVNFNGGNDRLIFEEATRAFRCEIGIQTYIYEGLSSGTPGAEWGKIFKNSIEGSAASPSAFSVTFQPTQSGYSAEQSFRLSEENGFKADVLREAETGNLDVVKYSGGVVSYYNEKIKYGYQLTIRTATEDRVGSVVIGDYNRAISDDFGSVSVVLSAAFPGSQIWAAPLVLNKDALGGYSCQTTVLGREISAEMAGKSKVTISIKSGDITDTMRGTVTGTAFPAVDDSAVPYKQSQALSFPLACESEAKIPSITTTAYVSGRDSDTKLTCYFDCVTQYSYAENAYGVNDIVIQIPEKEAGSSISREFLFVVKPRKVGAKANIRFVGENGRDIKWFSNKQPTFEILTETFITFRLQEVRDDRFMVVDWNLNKQEQEIDDLYARLSAETSARISTDLSIIEDIGLISAGVWTKFAEHDRQISGISGEVSALILRDRKDISYMGELTANGYRSLSTFLGNQSVFGTSPMTATVHPNWMYRMDGNSELPMVDNAGVSSYIGDNDYVMFKAEKQVKDILFSDMNFIRDLQAETEQMAAAVCAWMNANFAHLSGGNSISGYNKFVGKAKIYQLESPSATVDAISAATSFAASADVQSLNAAAASVTSASIQSAYASYAAVGSAELTSAHVSGLSADSVSATSIGVSVITADTITTRALSIGYIVSADYADITTRNLVADRATVSSLSVPVSAFAASLSVSDISVSNAITSQRVNTDAVSASSATIENLTVTAVSAAASAVYLTELSTSAGSEIARLSLSASTNADGVSTNRTGIASLSGRYDNTFLPTEHASQPEGCGELSADNLRLFDEASYAGEDHHREYRMVLSSGTIVLKRINRLYV